MNLDRSTDSGTKGPTMEISVSTGVSAIESILTSEEVEGTETDVSPSSIFKS